MEIDVGGNSNVLLKPGLKTEFGRGSGIVTDDRTVSRRHVAFELLPLTTADEPKVRFQVIGRNPIWVHDSKIGKVNTFTSTQIGEMEAGEQFCVSAKNPFWFTVRKVEFGGQSDGNGKRELGLEEILESRCELMDGENLEPESLDISSIDPIKEFGFLVIGQEFDRYPKKIIRDMKDWDWFIEEPVEVSDDNEYQKRKKSGRKRKKGDENDDDEWTGEIEEENEQISSAQRVPKQKYTTRSKDHGKRGRDAGKDLHLIRRSSASGKKFTEDEEDDDDDDEADETLGGFIVDDELEQEEETDDNEDEEEFLEEDEEDE